jgi:tetratricopeptide (TPR) repeat protein
LLDGFTEMPAKSVFISHSSKDDAIVRDIREKLEGYGIQVWADSEHLTGGDLLKPEIQKGIENVDHFLAVVSVDALNSKWVHWEVKHARKVKKPGYKIIPLTRSNIGTPMLRPVFGKEPVAIKLGDGPGAVSDALPLILAALGVQLPTETIQRAQAQAAPLADLILELKDPAVEDLDGKRRATATATLTYRPADNAPKIESARFRFTSPIGPIEAEEISWYLERYINWPSGLFQERAQRTVDALPEWGRLLYDTVNVDPARNALEAWKSTDAPERRFTVKVDKQLIAGSPEAKQLEANEAATLLLALPWELLHDGRSYLFQGKRAVRVRRSLPNRDALSALATEPPIRVLLVSPRPEDESAAYIDHRVSARPLVEALSQLGDLARFKLLDPPTFPALEAELLRAATAQEPYHVVHFDGHGVYDRNHGLGQLCFEDPTDRDKLERRRSQLIGAGEIARIVRDHRVPLFFLEACQTAQAATDPSASVAARLLESGVASVAAMSHTVLVETARRFITEFYKELLRGQRVGQAMLAGQRALKSDTFRGKTFSGELRLEDWFVPVLFQGEDDPQLVAQASARVPVAQASACGELPAPPPHQFLGRSRDLLKAERILARERYLVVQGAGGEGKTTFAAELARWLVATRRFTRAAFTSVEQVTEARQVLFSIGAQLVPNFGPRVGTDEELGRQLVERALAEQATVLVIDNMESILEQAALGEILTLCDGLAKARLIFTTRESLPHPFASNVLPICRLDRDTAIRLVGNLLPGAPDTRETQEDLENLVDAVGGHARSLVLIAREVGAVGVRRATKNLRGVMRAIETKHPGQRENSLLASADLSLRRLPKKIRRLIPSLSVFHGGGSVDAIAVALQLDPDGLGELGRALIGAGLAEYVEPGYLRFDPALMAGDLTPEELATATAAWAHAIAAVLQFLYKQIATDASLALNLAVLELPNLLAGLVHLAESESPERVVDLATQLEQLMGYVNRPKALARVVEIRTTAAQRLGEWSHARFAAERAPIEPLIEQGRYREAVQAAQALHLKAQAAGDGAYQGAAYDGALAHVVLGQALHKSGDAGSALPHLDAARQQFERLNEARMAGVALGEKADCLTDLGLYDQAAAAYQQAIRLDEQRLDTRSVAVDKARLGTVRQYQKKYSEALRLHDEARTVFERLNEPASVAGAWHQIGNVLLDAAQYEAAEQAYQKSLNIEVELGNHAGQAVTLNQLGNLYSQMGRAEDSVRLYRQVAGIFVSAGDLRNEGGARANIACELIQLGRFAEARLELDRAIECDKPFGHVAQPWKTFDILSDLERATGNQPAALAARNRALAAYLAYRRDGGDPQIDSSKLIAIVNQDPAAARAAVDDPDISYRTAAEILLALEPYPS